MTITEYLYQNKLIDSQNELTERANYLGYQQLTDLEEDIVDIYLIDFKTKTIIPPYDMDIYINGESNSSTIKFRVYDNPILTNNISLIQEGYIPQILWKHSSGNKTGIVQPEKNIDGNIITFDWLLGLEYLINAGTLEFSVRFVTYDENSSINYNISTFSKTVSIKTGMNNIIGQIRYSIANPFINTEDTYIIDGGNISNG